ncbi:ADP-ribosylglycohydrolase family protein [uncultured Aquimarina sp.]|uniref:ADP-ribosylglycohydrolase family protein n=1 Tax=uncultured Aquimarina sp. TaxID=575652 RepID=UPI002608C044|nr:ADP-ribosylglycohydrolase family protein [uncultured Aquimarina sp.]
MITKKEKFLGSMFLGVIGDAMGSGFENISKKPLDDKTFYPFGKPKFKLPEWRITDDTQLTIITCEALLEDLELKPEVLSKYFVNYFSKGIIRGIGASTLKAFQELQIGIDWSQTGRRGEYAAGNGAAMRIAPLAFIDKIKRNRIEDICSITHKNSEAYIGALAVVISIRTILNGNWLNDISLLKLVADQLPSSNVRERILELSDLENSISIQEVAKKYGNDGYVVNSIPFCIFAASKIKNNHISFIFDEIIESEGDTDTNCSITGQICGTYLGINKVPLLFKEKLKKLPEYDWLSCRVEELGAKTM